MSSDLEQMLASAGPAHHAAFIETDGADPEWPIWYAEYLRRGVAANFGVELTKSELTYHLVDIERQRRQEDPEAPWPAYYANALRWRAERGELGGFE